MFSVRAVYFVQGQSRTPVPRIDEGQKAGILSSVGQQQPSAYEVLIDPTAGTVVRVFPAVATGTLEVEYIAEIPKFTGDSDVWYGPVGSDELLTTKAAAKGCRKEGRIQDAQALLGDYALALESIRDCASWVDQRNPAKIRDAVGPMRDAFDYFAVGPNSF